MKRHAVELAEHERRPFAARDQVEEGRICVFSVLEPCRTFSSRFEKGKPFVASARRKCLFLYFYFMDRDFGLIHVKLQTWFPPLQQIGLKDSPHLKGITDPRRQSAKVTRIFNRRIMSQLPFSMIRILRFAVILPYHHV